MNDDARDRILARRARFIAAATAGFAAIACSREPAASPEPCLSQPQTLPDAGEPELETDPEAEPEAEPTPDAGPPPMPCLSPPPQPVDPPPPPEPQPCLSVAPPPQNPKTQGDLK